MTALQRRILANAQRLDQRGRHLDAKRLRDLAAEAHTIHGLPANDG